MQTVNFMGLNIPLDDKQTWDFLCAGKNLKGVFQMETSSASRVLMQIKPRNIEELSLTNACNRPGASMFTKEITEIKDGKKIPQYKNKALEPILKETFSKFVYQEQLQKCATQLAGYSPKDSAKYLKILGKKLSKELLEQRDIFIGGMQKNGYDKNFAEELFEELKGFANYGFNKCLSTDTKVETPDGYKNISDISVGNMVRSFNVKSNVDSFVEVLNVFNSKQEIYEVTLEDGRIIKCSLEHKFLCDDKVMRPLKKMVLKGYKVLTKLNTLMQTQNITSIKYLGVQDTVDLEVNHPDHNFYAEGIVTSNSHSVSYSQMGFASAFIKIHHSLQFFTSLLNFCQYEQAPINEVFECVSELPDFNIKILPPSLSQISNKFTIENGNIRYPVGLLKGLGDIIFEKLKTINTNQLNSLDSVLESLMNSGINSRSIESIVVSGAMDYLNVSRSDILFYYWFLSELKPEILERFWLFKNGSTFSHELVFNFLNHREQIGTKIIQGDLFDQNKINENVKYKSYFKTEKTRVKTLEKVNEHLKTTEFFKKNEDIAKFFWETYSMGFAYNYRISPNLITYREIDTMRDDVTYSIYGFVHEIKHRVSKKKNPYTVIALKFDKQREFMLFSEVHEGAKDVVREGDFVKLYISKRNDFLKVESINVDNETRNQFEFYNKRKISKDE